MLFASISFALYIVLAKKIMQRLGTLVVFCLTCYLGSLFFLPLILGKDLYNSLPSTRGDWLLVSYLSILGTGMAYLFYFLGLMRIEVSKASQTFYLKPILASLLSIILLGERFVLSMYVGTAIILFSLALVLFVPSDTKKLSNKSKF